jgi:Ca2+-transporting ATPase
MASVVVEVEGGRRSFVRGALEVVLARCTSLRARTHGDGNGLDDAARAAILAEGERWAARSMRVIGLACRDLDAGEDFGGADPEAELAFIGLVGIVDPPRPEVAPAIAEARAAGIETIMITGDHPATARAIAEEIGLWREGDLLMTGAEVDALPQAELVSRIDRLRAVARATAENKLRVVEALKARGRVCAMTGDGVNDAPAVKAASIGIAMGGTGTDVTKEAADLVLADDNYATIVQAVAEGRSIYANIRKFIFFLLSSNAGIVLMVLVASLLGWHAPLAPIHILWINLITNGLPALALGVDKPDPSQMKQPPREPGGSILDGREYLEMTVVGVVMAATALWAFHHALADMGQGPHQATQPGEALAHARTVCFAILAIGPLFHALNCRSKTRSLFALGVFGNLALWGAIAVGLVLELATIYVPGLRPLFKTAPLSGEGLLWVVAMSLAPFVLGELVKLGGGPPSARTSPG